MVGALALLTEDCLGVMNSMFNEIGWYKRVLRFVVK